MRGDDEDWRWCHPEELEGSVLRCWHLRLSTRIRFLDRLGMTWWKADDTGQPISDSTGSE